ncbi:MAG TPA: SGNH/GDSL hydrolase family protein [Ktedonobacteraceae bacterium]|jgi:lysophospholipase L1-like esterase|nr:SGNH/GDSL hydrolase family protein [Ktedonobacteraceae bacterium]
MLKNAYVFRFILAPLFLVVFLGFSVAPVAFAASNGRHTKLVGPKKYYLALGDSLAFGYQPDLNWDHGYVDDFFSNLKGYGVKDVANMGCPGETSNTFINGGCPYSYLRKFPYVGPQLSAAVTYLQLFAGQVSPVTLDIGANDLLPDINPNNCSVSSSFNTDLQTLDKNLTQIILPQLKAALTVHGQVTGDLVMMNYYDPYQNICPQDVPLVQMINQHLANDVSGFGIIVDVFSAFGGPGVPNKHICSYTWMCSFFNDIHATTKGYKVIANTFEQGTGY